MRLRLKWELGLLALVGTSCSMHLGETAGRSAENPIYFAALTNFADFKNAPDAAAGTRVLISPEIATPLDWDELVISWNTTAPPGTQLKFEARAVYPEHTTVYYTLGLWSEAGRPRESVNGQKDEDGDVKTDTLVLEKPARAVQVRITLSESTTAAQPRLKFLGLSFLNTKIESNETRTNRAAWAKTIDVPERSQNAYSGGSDWCSPTAVSMVLAYWSKTLHRPELDVDVPDVAKAVHDPNWPGTGNWPFNTAFAGHFPGIRACVARFENVAELEDWMAAGLPVIASVSPDLLNGAEEDKGNGHLVVCVGITDHGDPIINDPWARLERGQKVRRVYSRANLLKAWQKSHRTVYLIYPETSILPPNRWKHWP